MTLKGFRQRNRWRLLAAILAGALPIHAMSQSVWNGSVNNHWSVSGNWDNNNVPGDSVNEDAVVNSGSPIVNGNFDLRDFDFTGGSLHGAAGNTLDVQGVMTWSGGSIASDGFVNVTGSLDLSGMLSNAGHLIASITVGSIGVDLGTILDNSGTLSVSGSTLNLRAGTNSGRLEAGTGGTILFQGVGSYTLAAGTTLAGDGVFAVASAVQLQESVAANNVSLSGSLLGGTLTTAGDFRWSSGEMKGGGRTTIATGSLQLTTAGLKSLEGRELVNDSTIEWGGSGDFQVHSGATLVNNNRFTITGDATMSAAPLTTPGTLLNSGTVEKTAGSGTTSILIPFQNTGTVSVTGGTLRVSAGGGAGTWLIGPGATMIFAAGSAQPGVLQNTVTLTNAGSLINAGFLSVPASALIGNNLVMDQTSAAELNLLGDLPAEAFVWNRGVLSGPGTTTTTGISFSDAWGVAGGRTLSNNGSITWAMGATWGLGLVDVISAFDNVNPGTIQNNSGAKLIFDADGEMGLPQLPGALKVENDSEISVSDGKNVALHGSLNNDGSVSVGNGATMALNAGGNSVGEFLIGENGLLKIAGESSHSFSGGVRIDGIGSATGSHKVLFDSASVDFSGQVGSLMTLENGADSNSGATLNLLNGAQIQARSVILTGGSIDVHSGATIDSPELHLNGGRMTVEPGASINVGSTTVGTDAGASSTLKLNSGAMLQSEDFELKTTGLLLLDGGTVRSSNAMQLGGFGSVVGTGTLDGSVATSGAILTPGIEAGELGSLHITDELTLDASSLVGIDIDADTLGVDSIEVGSALELGGALLFVTVVGNPSNLTAANSFVILSSAVRSGSFSTTIDPGRVVAFNLQNEAVGEFSVNYTGTDVILSQWVPEPPFQAAVLAGAMMLRRRRLPCGV